MKIARAFVGLPILLVVLLHFSACGATPAPGEEPTSTQPERPTVTLKLATTTVVNDSGLLEYLEPSLWEEEGIALRIMTHRESADAIETAREGGCDVLLTHGPAAEKAFVEEGLGAQRREFMHNFFAVAGPKEDPAGVACAKGAAAALEGIYDAYLGGDADCVFFSRDDGSWADRKEKNLWADRGIDPGALPAKFYQRTGEGMRETLLQAQEAGGYAVTDKLSFLQNKEALPGLAILLDNNKALKNIYSVTLLSQKEFPELQHEAAERFSEWLLQPSTQARIAAYGKAQYGEALFFAGK